MLLILHRWSTVLISCFCIYNDLHMVGGRGLSFFAFIILTVHIVNTGIHCIHWNREKSGCWFHLLLYSCICSHPILWLNATVQSFAFSASYLCDPIVAVAKEGHFLALPVWSLVTLVCPWCIPSWRLNVLIFIFFFCLVFLKRCIGIHDHADSVRGIIKKRWLQDTVNNLAAEHHSQQKHRYLPRVPWYNFGT